jgi:uncharacterized Ntn-hydrolase superfamily protein
MLRYLCLIIFILPSYQALPQDTFSIVAVDSITGEVGSAGASCVPKYILDNFKYSYHFIGQLFPGKGAINTQALYIIQNQQNAAVRMYSGDTPAQIIDWLSKNDYEGNSSVRQYGVAALIDGKPQAAAFTGSKCLDWKGHITGPNYSIQGNILLGKLVVDSMEARFLSEDGTLADKLMAALQGANIVGADTRCQPNGTSSLFAYIKVVKPDENPEQPGLLLNLAINDSDGIEPIDSLQKLYNEWKTTPTADFTDFQKDVIIYPNPASEFIVFKNNNAIGAYYSIYSIAGNQLKCGSVVTKIDISDFVPGLYFLKLNNKFYKLIKL